MFLKKNDNAEKCIYRLAPVKYIIIFFIAGVHTLLTSCHKTTGGQQGDLSAYNKVIDSVNLEYDHNRPAQAVKYLDSVSRFYKNLDILQKFEYYAINYNYIFHKKGDNVSAMLYADSILDLFDSPEKKEKYIFKYGQAFFFKGDVLFAQNKFDEAYQFFYRGKLIAKKGVDKCTLGDFSYHMGMIMYKQEHYRAAAANFKNSWDETSPCDLSFRGFYRRQELLSNAALSYSKIGETDSATLYFKAALAYIDNNASRFTERPQLIEAAKGVIYGNEANVYIRTNNALPAKSLLKQSISINLKKGNDNQDAELSELKLAHLYYHLDQTDSLGALLDDVNRQFDTVKNDNARADWNLMMSEYHEKKGNTAAALKYFVRYDALKDSIDNVNKTLKEADIAQQIKRLEKDNEFDSLKKNNRQQYLFLQTGAVFGVMVLIILLLISLNWRRSGKNIKVLGSLNRQINDQNHDLEQALHKLKQSSQEKDRMLRTVAHDLRNPIGGIASLTLAMADDEYSDEQKEMIDLIRDTSTNTLELINEILEVTNNGAATLHKEPTDINTLISNSVELLRFKAAEKGQRINVQLLERPVELLISREKIWRVVSNLISNAIKFSPTGGEILVKLTDLDNEIEISIKDDGIGIPENLKDKVFNMFSEAKRPGTSGERSFGLGLSISKQIIESHDGTIWFQKNTGKGTTFFIRLPRQQLSAF